MIWSPLKWSRPAWDFIFIVDFTLTAILLVPQLLAWVYSRPKGEAACRRNVAGFLPAPWLIAKLDRCWRADFGPSGFERDAYFAALFLLPALRGWGLKFRHDNWNRAGFVAALFYVACTVYAHHVAFARIQKFVELVICTLHRSARCRCRHPFGIGTDWFARTAACTSCAWISATNRRAMRNAHARASLLSRCLSEFLHRSGQALA